MNKALIILLLFQSFAFGQEYSPEAEEELYKTCVQMYLGASADRTAAVETLEKFIERYPKSSKAADAQFMIGEAYLQKGIELLKSERTAKRAADPRKLSPKNPSSLVEVGKALSAFDKVIRRYSKSGLESSAQYRIGEIYYNLNDWESAIKAFKAVAGKYSKSYLAAESLLGIVYSSMALNRYPDAESAFFSIIENYPHYAKDPEVLFAKGMLSANRGEYESAEKTLELLNVPQAKMALGRTYIQHGKPYMAASVFEKFTQDFSTSDVKEDAELMTGDSFFRAKDYQGAIVKYRRFLEKYPESKYGVAAQFRIGASMFSKKDYVSARNYFQAIVDKYALDFFAPFAQYFIAESYLANGEYREAFFGYNKVVTQYKNSAALVPLAGYKLIWCHYKLGDLAQAIRTSQVFLANYPNNDLAKNIYLILGNSLLEQKKYSEAVQSFQSVIDLAPSSEIAEHALLLILKAQYEMKNYSAIITSYQFLIRRLPPSQSQWRGLSYLYAAEAYIAMNLVEEAEAIYDMVLRVYPWDASALYAQDGLAWCRAYRGEYALAAKSRDKLKEMLSASPSSAAFSSMNGLAIADSMFNSKEYEQAYQMYEKFADENADSDYASLALYRAGLALYKLKYYTQAVTVWQKLSEKYPSAKETETADYHVADTYFRAQKYSEAVSAYKKITEKYPDSAQSALAYLRIAQSDYNGKNDTDAIAHAREVLKRFPAAQEAIDAMDLLEAVFDRSPAMFKGVFAEIASAGEGTQVAGEAQFRLGRRLFEKKEYEAAVEELKKFSVNYTAHPSMGRAQFYLGEACFHAGKFEESAEAFARFISNYPESEDMPLAIFRLGSAYYNLKNYGLASASYQKLVDAYPKSEYIKPAMFNLALSYKSTGKADLAQETYRKYYDLAGEDPSAMAAMWEIFNLQKSRGDSIGALKTLTQIQASKPGTEDELEALYRMGEINMDENRISEAKNSWEKTVPLKPAKSPYRLQALIKLGEVYEKEGDYIAAAGFYDDLAKNAASPDVVKAARERAVSLRKMKTVEDKKTAQENVKQKKDAVSRSQPAQKQDQDDSRDSTDEMSPAVTEPAKMENLPGMKKKTSVQSAGSSAPALKK